jgi:hypothetical protein
LVTVGTADTSIGATQYAAIKQPIEGLNISDFNLGTASAEKLTLSFWVQSSLTGIYCVSLYNNAEDRIFPAEYTISVANTWEKKTISLTGDTSGTWLTTNGNGLNVTWWLAIGSTYRGGTNNVWGGANNYATSNQVNWMATSSNTFYITGVQLETGALATSFDFRSIGTELALCQRYLVGAGFGNMGIGTGSSNWNISCTFPVAMRATPTLSAYTGTLGTTNAMTDSFSVDYILTTAVGNISNAGTTGARTTNWTTNNAGAAGRVSMWNSPTAVIQFSAEL